jgi:hypothetical protein
MKKYKSNNKLLKNFSIILLLAVLIYILYFQSLFENSEIKSVDKNLKESFSYYMNICGNKDTNFYNIPTSITPIEINELGDNGVNNNNDNNYTINKDGSSCEYYCRENDCDLYLINSHDDDTKEKCSIYKDLDGSSFTATISCNKKENHLEDNELTHYGVGYVKPDFFKNNKAKFMFEDHLLKKATSIKNDYAEINDKIGEIRVNNVDSKVGELRSLFASLNNKINNLGNSEYLDISLSKLYTNMFTKLDFYNIKDTSINFLGEDITYIPLMKKFNDLNKSSKLNEGKLEQTNYEYNRRNIMYIILTFLTFITAILLILFKINDELISNSFMFIYFFGVIFLVFFLHTFLDS